MMVSRRNFLRSLSLAPALPALPGLAQWNYERTSALTLEYPKPGDPAYWKKVRKMFLLPENKAFFNTGTLGAQPAVVYETVAQHMHKVAAEIADWDYKGDDWISGYQPLTVIRGKLGDYLRSGLQKIPRVKINTPLHPAMCAGITNFQIEGVSGTAMQDALWLKGIRIRGNRQSTHIYNNEAELDATLNVLRQLAA